MAFNVFVSGNQTELSEERFAVKEVINDNPVFNEFFDVFLFEDVPATRRRPDFTYIGEVKNSDIFLCILGNKYGSRNDDGISPTEKELRTFIEHSPHNEIFIFVKGRDDEDRDEEIQKLLKLIKDPPKLKYQRFEDVTDLKEHVTKSLLLFLRNNGLGLSLLMKDFIWMWIMILWMRRKSRNF